LAENLPDMILCGQCYRHLNKSDLPVFAGRFSLLDKVNTFITFELMVFHHALNLFLTEIQ
jgi:hypothetical protein